MITIAHRLRAGVQAIEIVTQRWEMKPTTVRTMISAAPQTITMLSGL